MRKVRIVTYGLTALLCVWAIGTSVARAQESGIVLFDNCDPKTFPAGLCVASFDGDTTFQQFLALLFSPLSPTIVGHPAWRMEPSYFNVEAGEKLLVTNHGGEGHTFTEVVNFGGGSFPFINGEHAEAFGGPAGTIPLTEAPECPLNAPPGVLSPGASVNLKLSPGLHNFMCCIHPWMRAVVDVEE